MKAFLILLLLTNIIFALIQWLLPYEQVISKPTPPLATASLQLLDEPSSSLNLEPAAEHSAGAQETEITAAIPDKLCYTLGPFKEQQSAQEVALKFKQSKLPISSRSSQEKVYRGMMVYVDGHKSREDAVKTSRSLAAKGVRDYIIVNEPGKNNILSLGVFGLKKYAERRYKKIAKMGYLVKSEERYRNRTIYWLDYTESQNESLTQFIESLKIEKGVSRISRKCDE